LGETGLSTLEDYFGAGTPKGVCLIDMSSVAVSAAKAQSAMTGEDITDIKFLRHLILNSILSNRKRFKGAYPELILAFDGKGNWRKEKYPFYKAHRQSNRNADSFDWSAFFTAYETIKSELRSVFPFKMIEIDGVEADDIIGVIASTVQTPVLIHAKDSDFNQCCRYPNVQIYSPFKKAIVLDENAEHNLFVKICKGEVGDGIPNILSPTNSFTDKIRQKAMTSSKIAKFKLDGIGDADIAARFEQNRELIDFQFIPQIVKDRILEAYATPTKLPDKAAIFAYLTQKELSQISSTFLSDLDLLT